ncbi:cytochrome b/b6 domain-containing protein [Variovorax sp. J22G21]|uniref:cytochrome b/b6 domain-containing protein n=1 Tax=Variovorax fucosicus TaxID=3053517 RepID=UPI0025763454|nr:MULTISPECIES: cytochrome b/b6 domain-containing protein [unclassified Variovorax]MDM0038867.1 cytochrome b/b6 domain-containing protein [Variovorax sp. J22R193]MDM0063643.1 cytochrome b/b6 domain-containing protein [Variovorax sp. J22G21]
MSASFEPTTHRAALGDELARPARIWDLPTRLFHWALALAVICLLVTGLGGVMEWHFRFGYAVLALLLFRLVWGFVGGRWSRFAAFIYSPRSVLAYLAGRAHPDHLIGHTPLGAFSVFALLGILALQVASGLVADDEISASGPLTRFVSNATVSLASGWHTRYGKWIVIGLVSLHVLAILFYVLVKRDHLIRPMFSGDKLLSGGRIAESRDNMATRLMALLIFALCAGFAAWIASLRA